MTLRRREDGRLLFHFTVCRIELPEEPFFWPRVWGGNAETEGEAIVEWILGRFVGVGDHGRSLRFDDGDAYIEGLAMSFQGDELYRAELVDSPDAVICEESLSPLPDDPPELRDTYADPGHPDSERARLADSTA